MPLPKLSWGSLDPGPCPPAQPLPAPVNPGPVSCVTDGTMCWLSWACGGWATGAITSFCSEPRTCYGQCPEAQPWAVCSSRRSPWAPPWTCSSPASRPGLAWTSPTLDSQNFHWAVQSSSAGTGAFWGVWGLQGSLPTDTPSPTGQCPERGPTWSIYFINKGELQRCLPEETQEPRSGLTPPLSARERAGAQACLSQHSRLGPGCWVWAPSRWARLGVSLRTRAEACSAASGM